MESFINSICVIRRESHIKAKTIKIKTMGPRQIEEMTNLVNNGISALLSSHSRTPEGYQIFLQPDADGDLICERIIDALLNLSHDGAVVERINC